MHVHEYQAKSLLARRGIPAPAGHLAASPRQAGDGFEELHVGSAVVKAQVHSGGRGKASGILDATNRPEAEAAARRLLGTRLRTRQTGPHGLPVNSVLVEEWLDVADELYLSVSLDRDQGRPLALASARGGMDIEELGRTEPEAILREYGDPARGFADFRARKLAAGLGVSHDVMKQLTHVVTTLGTTFVELDCSLIEINPLVVRRDSKLVAADVKMSFDDNALGLHPELADLRDTTQEDPREVEAKRHDLSYVGLEGTIGCMVNGAGLAMATMDLIRLNGAEPANFLDVGGAATAEKVAAAFRLICRDERVRAILVNIFGGIVRCDLIAEGILDAVKEVRPTVPLVVRLAGTKAEEGRRALAASDLSIISAHSLEEAAAKAAEPAKQ